MQQGYRFVWPTVDKNGVPIIEHWTAHRRQGDELTWSAVSDEGKFASFVFVLEDNEKKKRKSENKKKITQI